MDLSQYRVVPIVLIACLAVAVLFLPMLEGVSETMVYVLALTVFIIGLMATGAMPEAQVSAVYFASALAFQVAPSEVVLSSFLSSAFWLIAGGVVLGVAAITTGLGARVAAMFTGYLSRSYARVITGVVLSALILAFLIPAAIARMIILMPIVLALADRLGFEPGRKGRTGMALAVAVASFYLPMTILPSNFPNVLLAGLAHKIYGVNITYGEYLLMNFPVAGAVKAVVLIVLICWMFNDRIDTTEVDHGGPGPLSADGRRLAVIIGLTVAGWATDFIHGVQAGWIAVAAAAVCLLPGLGVLVFDDFKGRMNGFVALFNVATVISLGAVIATSGAGDLIAGGLFSTVEFTKNDPAHTFGVFSGINILMGLIATLPGTIAVLTPFAGNIAETTGLALLPVIMMVANGYGTVFLPYQVPPVMAGLRMGGVSIADGSKLTLALSTVTVAVLLPLTYVWWSLLGYL